ncbi:MAG: twin-arginine translocase TatA/TatE family subunit [Thermodesulfobacteriota bacterium]
MFGLGASELLIILIIALIVLGPKEIPKIAKTLGRGMRELERAKNELRKNIEFDDDDIDFNKMIDAKDHKKSDEKDTKS